MVEMIKYAAKGDLMQRKLPHSLYTHWTLFKDHYAYTKITFFRICIFVQHKTLSPLYFIHVISKLNYTMLAKEPIQRTHSLIASYILRVHLFVHMVYSKINVDRDKGDYIVVDKTHCRDRTSKYM